MSSAMSSSRTLTTRIVCQRLLGKETQGQKMGRAIVVRSFSSGNLSGICNQVLNDMKLSGTFKEEKVLMSKQSAEIKVKGSKKSQTLNFCANNYLGLCDNKEIEQAAKDAIDKWGYGVSSVRFICGTQGVHKELEERLSNFHGFEDCILFPSGFDANAGFFESLLTDEDAVISDSLNHASIIDGIRLCKAKRFRYSHLDMADLEKCIKDAEGSRIRIIVTDGVFSMDGDVAPLRAIRKLADKYPNTYIYVDECHATGSLGKNGRGTPELLSPGKGEIITRNSKNGDIKVDFISSTLGKTMGGATGGYIVASKEVVSLLRNKARTYLFTNAVAPAVCGASLKVLDILERPEMGDKLREKLMENTHYIRQSFWEAGLSTLGHDDCPIVPLYIGDAIKAQAMSANLLERGILGIAFSFPVVPKEAARIRFQISAGHQKEHLQKCVAAVVGAAKELGIIDLYKTEAATQKVEAREIEEKNAYAQAGKAAAAMEKAASKLLKNKRP